MKPHPALLLPLFLALVASDGAAQGFGQRKYRCDAQALTAHSGNGNAIDDGLLGVQFLGGNFYVTGRDATHLSGQHSIYVFNAAGQRVSVFDQPSFTATSAWGFRDGMSDGVGLAFGYEDGLGFVSTSGTLLTTFAGVTIGAQPMTLAGYPPGLVYRALAFDPIAVSVFVGDYANAIYELSLATGVVLNSWPNLAGAAAWSAYGFAFDRQLSTAGQASLWVNGDAGSNAIRLYRLPRNGVSSVAVATSSIIKRDQPLSAVGGLSDVPGGTPGASITSAFDLAGLDQGATDVISTYRVHAYATCNGAQDAYLIASSGLSLATAQRDKQRTDTLNFFPGDWMLWDFVEPSGVQRLSAVWGNVKVTGLDETTDRLSTIIDPSFELRVAWAGSTPAGFLPLYLGPNATSGAGPSAFPVPVGIFNPGEGFRVQGFFIDFCNPAFPVVATNQVRFIAGNGFRPPVRIEAEGPDNFNADTTRGFWRIFNGDRLNRTITSVTFDWATSTNPQQATMRFDTDQTGMGSVFEGGNSANPSCLGTYRNNSHVTTGLVFDPTCTIPATPCDPAANTGWIGTNAGANVDDWRTLQFRFTDFQAGEFFEFDCDTDGGQGITGSDMEGMRVTVVLSDNTVLTGALSTIGFQKSQVIL